LKEGETAISAGAGDTWSGGAMISAQTRISGKGERMLNKGKPLPHSPEEKSGEREIKGNEIRRYCGSTTGTRRGRT